MTVQPLLLTEGQITALRRSTQYVREHLMLGVGAALVGLMIVLMIAPGLVARDNPIALDPTAMLQPPSSAHWLGTDEFGRDLFSRIIYGMRNSLGVTFAVVLPAAAFGVLFGAVAGLAGGWVDDILMRITDIFLAFPIFVLAMAIAAARGRGLVSVFIALVLIWWPSYARLVRGKILTLRERDYVEAARAVGLSRWALIQRHILPFLTAEINVRVTTDLGYALVAVSALSFLGIGAQSPTPEWGLLISDSRTYALQAWWYLVFPGLAIVAATLIFTLVGEALAERAQRA
jgi:peptide/nickel transport system permease protein